MNVKMGMCRMAQTLKSLRVCGSNPGANYTDPGAQQGQQGGQYYDADYEVVDDDKDKK